MKMQMSLKITILTVLSISFLASTAASADEGCGVFINKGVEGKRTVLLSDGNAWSLFQQYLAEAESQGLKVNLSKVNVVLASKSQRKEFGLDWKQMLTGNSKKEIWARQLKNVTADNDAALNREAARQKWDMVCYAGAESSPQEARKPARGEAKVPLEAKQHLQQGMQYASRRDYVNACKEFSNAIQLSPGFATAYSNRGVAYMQQKKFDLAEDDLKKAVELGPKDGKNHYNMACWYSLQGQVGRGLASIDTALSNGFSDYEALRKDRDLARLRQSGDWQKTLEKHKIFIGSGK